MVITAALVFEGALDFQAFEQIVRERLLRLPRFTQRVAPGRIPLEPPRWVEDERFDIRNHLHRVALPGAADHAELERYVSDRLSTPLPPDRPLFRLDMIERVDNGSAVVARVHHCLADGVALVGVLLGMVDELDAKAPPRVGLPQKISSLQIGKKAREGLDQARSLGKMLMLPQERHPPLTGPLSPRKQAAWSAPISLALVKQIARRLDAKVNDVLCGAVAGALRSQLLDLGAMPARGERSLRALIPVFLQGAGVSMGNHFGLVFLDLPVGVPHSHQRVMRCREQMRAIKHSQDAGVSFSVLGAMGLASRELETFAIDLFSKKATLLVSNVAGPPEKLHLAGSSLESIVVWAPVSGSVGLGVTLVSYGGAIRMAVASDARRLADPSALVRAFEYEIAQLAEG